MEKQNLKFKDTNLISLRVLDILRNNIVYIVFIAIFILFSIILRGSFLSTANLISISRQTVSNCFAFLEGAKKIKTRQTGMAKIYFWVKKGEEK